MNTELTSITLREWETQGPDNNAGLAGRFLDVSDGTRQVADRLAAGNLLDLTELRYGLEVKAFSHVGRVRIGDLAITILPKIKPTSLLSLLRYAYGFRRLKRVSDTTHLVDQCGFEDILISQLNAEVRELISRGLLRSYLATTERLGSPRGRIDLTRMALDGGTIEATLPCQHHPRVEDTFLNQVLMAGLRLAYSIASIVDLRRESRRIASLMEEQVSPMRLDEALLNRARRQMSRLTTTYAPALAIIQLLLEGQGIVLEGRKTTTTLPGFLFDMNSFFQALMSRFLRDNLPGHSVRDEHGLKGMMRYHPKFNPRQRQSPTPRPDYIVSQEGVIRSILDAKYRDLWEKSLPREMLYQLVVYAIGHPQLSQSTILYPTADDRAKEARIDVVDPIFSKALGQVRLRPVELARIETLMNDDGAQARRDRTAYANWIAFGGNL